MIHWPPEGTPLGHNPKTTPNLDHEVQAKRANEINDELDTKTNKRKQMQSNKFGFF